MHEFLVARRVLDFRDPPILGEIRRDHEATIDVAGARGHGVRLGHLEHVIGRPESPPLGKDEWRRKLGGIALGRTRLEPANECRQLGVGEAPRLDEITEAGYGLPGRHHAPAHGIFDVVPPLVRVTVGEQRKRRVLARPVTRLTPRLEDPDDLVVEGRRLHRRRRRGNQEHGGSCHPQKPLPHREPPALMG